MAVCFAVIVSGWQQAQLRQQVQSRLHDTAVIVRSHVADDWQKGRTEKLQQLIVRLGEETQSRITLVSLDGVVLADSDEDPRVMDNHRNRPELLAAAADGKGGSERTSGTLGMSMFYVALRADQDGSPVGLVRVALPMTSIHEQTAATNRLIWLVATIISLSVLVLTYWVVARIIRPLATLTQAAESITSGKYRPPLRIHSPDELGELAAAFNRMSGEMLRRESQLRQSGERLATVLSGMEEGVIAVDHRQRILFANEAAGRLLRFSAANCEGQLLLETVRDHALHRAVIDTLDGSAPNQPVVELDAPHNRMLAVSASRLPGEPCPGVVLVLHDVTEVRRLESLRRDFVANVSHELKTPLSSIKAYAETLQNGAIDDTLINRDFVRRIEEQAERLHLLIVDLLSLARIESGEQALEITDVLLAEVVAECLAHHKAVAQAKQISLESATELPRLRVRADKLGLQQILDNLVDNAIKYTPEGGHVTVRWRSQDSLAVVEVSDTGIGISPDHQARVFERFYRVDRARSRELGGTGLGLSIVKHLAQACGGRVDVVSAAGRGSTFSVWLPRA